MNTFYAKEKLPDGYRLAEKIDLVKNKRQFWAVNGLSVALAVVMVLIGLPRWAFTLEGLSDALKLLAAAVGIFIYIIAHEAVHGMVMWLISRKKPRFGFSLAYAYAGSDVYFAKGAYLLIAAAPLVFWGMVLTVLALVVPAEWFWPVWLVQIMNVSGSAGDLYVFFKMLRKPRHLLVQDTGTAMTAYL